jgi:hypothetical protein
MVARKLRQWLFCLKKPQLLSHSNPKTHHQHIKKENIRDWKSTRTTWLVYALNMLVCGERLSCFKGMYNLFRSLTTTIRGCIWIATTRPFWWWVACAQQCNDEALMAFCFFFSLISVSFPRKLCWPGKVKRCHIILF